jgi:hypothetical protein
MSGLTEKTIVASGAPVGLALYAGQALTVHFQAIDPVSGSALDLSAGSVVFTLKAMIGFQALPTGEPLIRTVLTAINAPGGLFDLPLAYADSSNLAGDYVWDLQYVATSDGARTPLIPSSRASVTATVGRADDDTV